MGGMQSPKFDRLTEEIWLWCMQRDLWVSASHVPGKNNLQAERVSGTLTIIMNIFFVKTFFLSFVELWGKPAIDLFASRLNAQLSCYASWKPDPGASSEYCFFAFPPFSMHPRCQQKIEQEEAEGILVVPNWPTQPWYPWLLPVEKTIYQPYIRNWIQHCQQRSVDPTIATVGQALEFLLGLFQKGLGYSALNTARCVLSCIIQTRNMVSFGSQPLVVRFLTALGFPNQLRPSLPRYVEIWNVQVVLNILADLHPPSKLSLWKLTLELAMLVSLVCGQRAQSIQLLDMNCLSQTETKSFRM